MLVEKRFRVGEATLNYAEGPEGGPPMVLTHGLTDRWQYYLPIMPFLTQRWHVYALDFRGHGRSSRTPPYRYRDHIEDAISFIEGCVGEPVVLFGSSMGGMVALMVAARRPDLVKAVVFGDSSIKTDRTRQVMIDFHSYWYGWRKLAGFRGPFGELVRLVSEMPVSVPGQGKRTYGEGLDSISLMNKANYLRHLDPEVLRDWAVGDTDADAFRRVTTGYEDRLLREIRCPVLLVQGNPKKGGIFTDEAVEFAKANIREAYHVYIPEYDHNLGLYSWDTGKLLQAVNAFLESLR
ncbi:MAG: alpha/beta hydrolase [Candidatus Bathyarchaeota archaeon]|nr:alpha/beta hydrolase [Candidatus Bathyarchaeota archaeon]